MPRHVEERHANSSALSNTRPKTVRFEDSFDVTSKEGRKGGGVSKKLIKGKAKVFRAPVAGRKVSQPKSK